MKNLFNKVGMISIALLTISLLNHCKANSINVCVKMYQELEQELNATNLLEMPRVNISVLDEDKNCVYKGEYSKCKDGKSSVLPKVGIKCFAKVEIQGDRKAISNNSISFLFESHKKGKGRYRFYKSHHRQYKTKHKLLRNKAKTRFYKVSGEGSLYRHAQLFSKVAEKYLD